MPNFADLLKKPAGLAKPPVVLPAGDYPGLVKTYEGGENERTKNSFLQLNVGLTDFAEGVPDEWEEFDDKGESYTVSKGDIDLSKRTFRRQFYLTDDALIYLDDFIRSCGIEPNGRSYEEIIPELIGMPIMVKLEQYLNQRTNKLGNQVGQIYGLGA